ncbi:MAG TPA: CocE/NonD family hydrolase [Bryobacteraceae bacterium]|nr:CocE/NonD family hydrolase [Bryobacteraceae bacterium]
MRVPLLILATGAALCAASTPAIEQLHTMIPMRDGVHLAANIFRPGTGRVPTILVRTPYGKGTALSPAYRTFVDHGYAVVMQDVRGRYESEGNFRPLQQEPQDGNDTLNWIAHQPWSNGKIGMTGGSYVGIVQWKVAVLNNPHLKAIFAAVAGDDDYRDRFYSAGGAMKVGQRLEWMAENMKVPGYIPDFHKFVRHLPLLTADVAATGRTSRMFQDAARHSAFDSFWRAISTREQLQKIHVPIFSVGGWYDNFVESDLEAYSALRKSSGLNRILIGPWPHNMSYKFAGVDFGPHAAIPVRGLQLQWFDQWLMGKDTPMVSRPPAKIFLMGVNEWREYHEWPPEGVRREEYYLESGAHANTLNGDGTLKRTARHHADDRSADHYVYDPRDPTPTRGGAVCCNPRIFPWGPMDQRIVEERDDVLVYTSKPLKQNLEVIGPVEAVLYVSTSAPDTDFTAKLVDIFPDGTARNLTDGILRLRYRGSLSEPRLATPGEVYRITIDAGVTSNVFLAGHSIRVEISSSNFPRFDRNPNTGTVIAKETRLVKANQTVYHDREHPSHIVLTVLGGETVTARRVSPPSVRAR